MPTHPEALEPGTQVTVWGFAPEVESADPRRRTVLAPSAEYDLIRLDESVAKGMSGGPVLDDDGRLVGVLCARSQDSACGYVVPVSAFADWLDASVVISRAHHLPTWLHNYLQSLARGVEDMPTAVMLRHLGAGEADHPLRTRALYVPLHVEPRRPEAAGLAGRATPEAAEPEPLLQALADNPRLVVRGDPGCGKSTFLRYLALRLIARLLGEDRLAEKAEERLPAALDGALPLFIELKGFFRALLGSGGGPLTAPPSAAAVEAAMLLHLRENHRALRDAADGFRALLFQGDELRVVWLLDGLDEISIGDDERHRLIRGLAGWARDLPPRHLVCLTTRPYAYAGQPIAHFDSRLVQPLQTREIAAFVERFCRENGHLFRPEAGEAEFADLGARLLAVLEDPERDALLRIARNPLLLTLTTALYCKDGESALPRDRGALYGVCLEALLRRWEEKLDRSEEGKDYSLHDATLDREALHAALDHLGFHAHLGLSAAGAADRENGEFTPQAIAAAFEPRLRQGYQAAHILDYLQNRTGLILARGEDRFAFIHRSFREYLAARRLVANDSIRALTAVTEACAAEPGWWREVLALATRLGDRQRGPLGSSGLLAHLLPFGPEPLATAPARDRPWSLAELVAHAEAERDPPPACSARRWALRARCVRWLVRLIEDDGLAAYPAQREQAAITLGRLGDPRRGVGRDPEFPALPEIDWVDIPAGVVNLEGVEGSFTIPQPFRIARYPITNAQFQAFVEDPDGHAQRAWWAGFETEHQAPEPSYWQEPNHPRTDVSWFEAVAFCRWLDARLKAHGRLAPEWEVRLPSEWEWQQAATGGDPGKVYPWGLDYRPGCANTNETTSDERVGPAFLGRTSAVGLYPAGASAQGAHDLAGNVWEWCANPYRNPRLAEPEASDAFPSLRGGGWNLPASLARAACRGYFHPSGRVNGCGFRVLCWPPSLATDH